MFRDLAVESGYIELDFAPMIVTDIPVRSRYPLNVTLVAYQYGRTFPFKSLIQK